MDGRTPPVTTSHVRRLLNAPPDADLVLYLSPDNTLKTDHESAPHPARVVFTQEAIREIFTNRLAEPPTDDDLEERMDDLQDAVDLTAARLEG